MVGGTEKGKIPRSEWPKIVAKYRAGETIAHIGRDYGCTAPAIRYIIKRSGELRPAAIREVPEPPLATRAEAQIGKGGLPRLKATGPADRVLDTELRRRVSGDIASFLVALDQAVVEGSAGSAATLQDATDRLMRSIARIRLELERLLVEERTAGAGSRHARSSAPRPARGN